MQIKVSAGVARQIGPQQIGGRYACGYWQRQYELVAIDVIDGTAWFTVVWEDGTRGRHATAGSRGDSVISQPAGAR